jgi:hypothetical protein
VATRAAEETWQEGATCWGIVKVAPPSFEAAKNAWSLGPTLAFQTTKIRPPSSTATFGLKEKPDGTETVTGGEKLNAWA